MGSNCLAAQDLHVAPQETSLEIRILQSSTGIFCVFNAKIRVVIFAQQRQAVANVKGVGTADHSLTRQMPPAPERSVSLGLGSVEHGQFAVHLRLSHDGRKRTSNHEVLGALAHNQRTVDIAQITAQAAKQCGLLPRFAKGGDVLGRACGGQPVLGAEGVNTPPPFAIYLQGRERIEHINGAKQHSASQADRLTPDGDVAPCGV